MKVKQGKKLKKNYLKRNGKWNTELFSQKYFQSHFQANSTSPILQCPTSFMNFVNFFSLHYKNKIKHLRCGERLKWKGELGILENETHNKRH